MAWREARMGLSRAGLPGVGVFVPGVQKVTLRKSWFFNML